MHGHGRYVDVAREKRSLESSSVDDGQPDRKRPALARLISCFAIYFNFQFQLFLLFLDVIMIRFC